MTILNLGTAERPLRLLTLNIWGGRVEELREFIAEKKDSVDVFCFQETGISEKKAIVSSRGMRTDIHTTLQQQLTGHRGEFFAVQHDYDENELASRQSSGNAIFTRKGIPITGTGREFIYGHQDSLDVPTGWHTWPRNLCWNTLAIGDKKICVMSMHGFWNQDKRDCSERIAQAHRVRDVMIHLWQLNGPETNFILAGDFNLDPDTESMAIMLDTDMVNLVTEHRVTNTRTPHYRKYFLEGASLFADYILVSKEIQTTSFQVCPESVSDHAALEASFITTS